ncbi:MAG: CvpA family protein [Bacteroidaceae bacterium]|nr:CvpA family protein [Bacteroidaceae bacterium]
MNILDILLLILLGVGFINGLFSGAIKQVISLVAFMLGFIIACLYYQKLAEVLAGFLSMPALCKVIAFVLLWVIVPIVVNLVGSLVSSLMNHLPVIGFLNRLLGGVVCMVKYALVLGAFIWFFSSIKLLKEETMQNSKLCRPLKALPELVYNTLYNK